jgi:hypothetical protein
MQREHKLIQPVVSRGETPQVLPMTKLEKDDVERLASGRPTRCKRGSRDVGHRLTSRERVLFEAAKRQGYLKLPKSGIRQNVANVYRLWCEALNRIPVIKQA